MIDHWSNDFEDLPDMNFLNIPCKAFQNGIWVSSQACNFLNISKIFKYHFKHKSSHQTNLLKMGIYLIDGLEDKTSVKVIRYEPFALFYPNISRYSDGSSRILCCRKHFLKQNSSALIMRKGERASLGSGQKTISQLFF